MKQEVLISLQKKTIEPCVLTKITPINMAPNQHRTGRKQFLLRIPDELYVKFRKFSELADMDMSDILLAFIVKSTADITLTEEDYDLLKTKARGRKS